MDYKKILNTKDAKTNFIKGLIRLAKADGVIDPSERQYFMSATYSLELDKNQIAEVEHCLHSDDVIHVEFATTMEKVLFFRDGIQLCAVDGIYAESERAEVRVMASALGIPETTIRAIEEWVEEGMAWKNRGDKLLVNLSK